MTYSNARIVRGNDFKLQITVEAPRDYVSGETIWDDFDLTSCSEIHVALICEKDQIVIPLEYEIVPGTTNVLLCPVHGNYLHSGAAYGVEVKGVDGSGYAWRWKAKGKEMFSIVDNTSAQNLDDNLTPENFDINARVGFEIHVDLSDYYTKEQVDESQAAQDEAIAALDDKVDANEADIEAKLAAERTRAQGAESTLQDNIDAEETRAEAAEQALSDAIDTLSGSTEGSLVQITARIAAEETRAQATEDDLQDAIDANSGAITAETNRAAAAEQANATAISTEATRAQAAEQANATAISTETSRAQAAESTLQDNIDAEETRAKGAEQANATAISTETSRAQGAESTLQDNIDAEETRAKAAEQANANAIAAEVTRATGAEEANATAISNEVTRAQGAEQGLQDQIDALEASAGGDISGLTQRIAAEETRAQAAEQAIDADVTALEAAMPLKANSADLATVATSGSYNDLSNKPTIPVVPTNVSAFTNDSGYLVAADIAGKADKADTYTKTEVDDKIDDIIGGDIDLQNYYTKSEVDASQQAQNNEIARKANQSTTYTKTEVDNLVSPKANSADLATVATSGSYNDLTDKPDIPAMQVQSDWNQTGTSEPDYIKNKPTIPTVPTDVSAFNNDAGYLVSSDIAGKADKADTYTKDEVDQIIEEVEAGQGSSLSNYYTKTQIDSQQQVQDAAIANKANSADLATVATSGDYDDLINKPTIPAAQVQSDWGETGTGEPSFIKNKPTNVSAFTNDAGYLTEHQSLDNYYTKTEVDNKDSVLSNAILLRAPQATTYTKTEVDNLVSPKANSADLATVATSGSYNDLSNKPHIPNDQVQADWGQTGTSEPDYIKNKPTNVSAFTNDAGYLTEHQSLDNYYTKTQVDEYENTQNLAILGKADKSLTYTKTEVDNLVSTKANSADLATVATSGSYNDLSNKPHIPNDQVQADWGQTGMTEPDYIKNKPTNVSAFTNDAGYLVSSDIAGKSDKSTTYTKTEVDNLVSPKANSADLATVATSGSYNDLLNKPHIPNDQVQADWGETGTGEPSFIKNKPDLSLKQDYEVTVGIQNQSNNYRVRIWEIRNDEVITDVCYKVVNDQTYTCPYTLSYRYDGSDNSWVSQDWTQLTTTYVVIPFSDNANIIELRLSSTGGELYRNIIPANKRVAYTKTEVDNLVSPKANSADLATVATSGSYNDLLNKPTIPTGVTFEVLPTKFADGTIAFDINELHNGKLGESYATEIANCADAEAAVEWWDDNALVELYYSTDNGTTWSNYNMKLYVSPTPGPTKIQLGTNGIWWKLYWYTDLDHEIASDIITGDTDLSNYYTKIQADDKFSALVAQFYFEAGVADTEYGADLHGVGIYWEGQSNIYESSTDYWTLNAPIVFWDENWGDDSGYGFNKGHIHLRWAKPGDEISMLNVHTTGSTNQTLEIYGANDGDTTPTLIQTYDVPANSASNPQTLTFEYTFEDRYDNIYIVRPNSSTANIGCQTIIYKYKYEKNDLGALVTRGMLNQRLSTVMHTWDEHQSDWNENDTNSKAYILNKPNFATVATSGSYNDLSNKPNLATVATSGSYNDLSNKPSIPDASYLVHKTGSETITGDKTFIGKTTIRGSMKLNLEQSSSTHKPGFTVYNSVSQEVGGFQYRPNTINSDGLLWLGHYNDISDLNQTYVGFRNSTSARTGQTTTAAYNLVCPLPVNAQTPFGLTATYQTFYLPLGFTDGTHTVRVPNTGLLNISNIAVTSSSTQGLKIEVVSEMPANPANNTLYVVQ